MEFDRYADADAFRLGKQIEELIAPNRPPELVELRFKTGKDNTGDFGLWISATLSGTDEDEILRRARDLRPIITGACRAVDRDVIPYLSFHSAEEEAEVAKEAVR